MNHLHILFGDYPEAIASMRTKLLEQKKHCRHLESALTSFALEIECQIAFDTELKNDTQRKAKKAELMTAEEYQGLLLEVQQAQDKFTEIEIQLELLRNQFAVEKLAKREGIAELETAA